MSNIKDFQYLLKLFNLVNDYLSSDKKNDESLPEIVVSFCVVTEKIFKIILHKKNPVLVFNNSKLKNENELLSIVMNKEKNVETIKIIEAVNRYKLLFDDKFSDDEVQILIDIYNIRNNLVHSYKPDSSVLADNEDVIKKMGTIWEKISSEVTSIFGADKIKSSKPKKKYTEEELENVLREEVRKKIQDSNSHYYDNNFSGYTLCQSPDVYSIGLDPVCNSSLTERCPRCGNYSFSNNNSPFVEINPVLSSFDFSKKLVDLYKCNICSLELTRKEYEIAKKIKNFSNFSNL